MAVLLESSKIVRLLTYHFTHGDTPKEASVKKTLKPLALAVTSAFLFGCGGGGEDEDNSGGGSVSALSSEPVIINEATGNIIIADFGAANSAVETTSNKAVEKSSTVTAGANIVAAKAVANQKGDDLYLGIGSAIEAVERSVAYLEKNGIAPSKSGKARIGSKISLDSLGSSGTLEFEQLCGQSGNISIVVDLAADSTVTYNRCVEKDGSTFSGLLTFVNFDASSVLRDLCSGTNASGSAVVFSSFGAADPENGLSSLEMSGQMEYCNVDNGSGASEVMIGADELVLRTNDNLNQLDDYVVRKVMPGDETYQFSMSGTVLSESADGSYQMSTTEPVVGVLQNVSSAFPSNPPSSGEIVVTGAEGATMKVVVDGLDSVTVQYDEDGDGVVDTVGAPLTWDALGW